MASTDTESVDTGPAWGEGSVTPSYSGHDNAVMGLFGWLIFVVMLIIIVPVLPFLALAALVVKLGDALGRTER
jgi:uncharacterized membrane protein